MNWKQRTSQIKGLKDRLHGSVIRLN